MEQRMQFEECFETNQIFHNFVQNRNMSTFTINAAPDKIEMIKSYLKSIQVSFSTHEELDTYNPEFVKKIERSRKQVKAGNTTRIKVEDLWK